MRWKKFLGLSGFIGAGVCGACLAKSFAKSNFHLGSVLAKSKEIQATVEDDCERDPFPGLKLKQVHVYFRHGARTPLNLTHGLDEVSYPLDMALHTFPYTIFKHQVVILPENKPKSGISEFEIHYQKTPMKGGGYAGNLSCWGQYQVYTLGLKLRDTYMFRHKLLPVDYSADDVHVQSTDIARTIASARCVLAGLYGKWTLNENGPVIIPVHRPVDEVMFPNSKYCSVLKKANHYTLIHPDNLPGNKEDRDAVERALGYDPAHPEAIVNFIALRDDMVARCAHGYILPEEIIPYMELIEHNATKVLFYAMTGYYEEERPIITRLSVGPGLHKAVAGMKALINGEEGTKKMYLYSSHDSMMVALLEALGVFDWKWPPFAADLRIELYQDELGEGKYWVRATYCGQELTVRDCSGPMCRFEDFEKGIAPFVIPRGNEFREICDSSILEKLAEARRKALEPEEEEGDMSEEDKEKVDLPAGMQ